MYPPLIFFFFFGRADLIVICLIITPRKWKILKQNELRLESNQNVVKQFVCCLCNDNARGHGNNPEPLMSGSIQSCCDNCNETKVIPARLLPRGKIEKVKEVEEFSRGVEEH